MFAEPPIYTMKDVWLSFGLNPLFTGIEMSVSRGDKICLVGRNGSGKSTLLKIISGQIEAEKAEIFIQPGTKISYMPQEPDFSGYRTLREVVLSGLEASSENQEYKADILIKHLNILENQAPTNCSGGELKKAALHVSQKTFWLDRGVLHSNNKGFAFFDEWQEQILEQEIIAQKYLNKKIEEETEWLHKGVTARRKRNQGRLRRLQQLRQERREQIKQIGSVNLEIDEGELRSRLVIEAKHIYKSYGDRELVKDFSIRVLKGNRLGIVGPNGAGKTTLIKLLTKKIEPDSGFVRIGKNLEEAYFDQNRITLDPKKTLWKTLCNEGDHIWVRGHWRHVVAYLKDFLFKPDQAQCPVSSLSGGEKNRLMLAVALAKASNFLVLDEPTNDLDMDTLDLLQEVLDEYQGTILIVSHDRDFMDKVATSLLYMKGDGSIIEHVGSYTELLEKLKNKQEKEVKKDKTSKPAVVEVQKVKIPTKLSYKDKRLLEVLPQEIAELESKISQIEQTLASDVDLYTRDPQAFDELTLQLEKNKQAKDEKENLWLEIQIKADEMAG